MGIIFFLRSLCSKFKLDLPYHAWALREPDVCHRHLPYHTSATVDALFCPSAVGPIRLRAEFVRMPDFPRAQWNTVLYMLNNCKKSRCSVRGFC